MRKATILVAILATLLLTDCRCSTPLPSESSAPTASEDTTTTSSTTTTTPTGQNTLSFDPSGSVTATTTTTRPTQQTLVHTVSLPSPGYDPDGKGRIRLGDVNLADTTLRLTVENVSAVWTTDETSYFEVSCYAQDGKVLLQERLYFGAVKPRSEKSGEMTIPSGTVRVELTDFYTEYWSEWKK